MFHPSLKREGASIKYDPSRTRGFPVARLTVDRPSIGGRAKAVAEWLGYRAEELESEPNCYTTGTFTARRLAYDARGCENTLAKLKVHCAGHLSAPTRKRIAKWMRSRAAYLLKHNAIVTTSRRGWFVQEFML